MCAKGHTTEAGKIKADRAKRPKLAVVTGNIGTKSYANALRQLETSVTPAEAGVKIAKLSRATDGNIRMLIEESSPNAAAVFANVISERTELVTTSRSERQNVFVIIRDIPGLENLNDLRKTLQTVAGPDSLLEVGTLRPTKAGGFSCILKTSAEVARKLSEKGAVPLG